MDDFFFHFSKVHHKQALIFRRVINLHVLDTLFIRICDFIPDFPLKTKQFIQNDRPMTLTGYKRMGFFGLPVKICSVVDTLHLRLLI